MITEESTLIKTKVLAYLKNMQKYTSEDFKAYILYAVRTSDIIKFIERPEACGRWDFEFVCNMEKIIIKISETHLIPFPNISKQTEEDRVLSKLLKKTTWLAFGTNTFFKSLVKLNHVIQYMERDPVIYNWNSYLVKRVQNEVKRVKVTLLQEEKQNE